MRLVCGVKPDVILYGCTSATLAHGPAFDRDLAERAEALAGAPAITAARAVVAALAHLGARRVAFASPYVPELNDRAIGFLAESGVETVSRADVETMLDNHGQGAMTPDDVISLARRADSAAAAAVVLSCTDMRAVEAVDRLEGLLGKPVVTSNQALAFAACRTLGRDPAEIGCGALFTRPEAA
jgi:maleate cis-trans isomerase